MRFKVDENLPEEIVGELRAAGHDASSVYAQGMSGVDDQTIVAHIREEKRGLITLDLGFADIRTYDPAEYDGLIVLRIKRQDKHSVIALTRRFIPKLVDESIVGKLWIVEEDRIRVRGETEE